MATKKNLFMRMGIASTPTKVGVTKKLAIPIFSVLLFLFLVGIVSAASNVIQVNPKVEKSGWGSDKIKFTVTLKNIGDTASGPFLVEIWPKNELCSGLLPALAVVSPQSTCDTSVNKVVHRKIDNLNPNEAVTIVLETPELASATYCLIATSTNTCCTTDSNCYQTQPFGWRTNIAQVKINSVLAETDVIGDGICGGTENFGNAPTDCTGWCGDGFCDSSKEAGWCGDGTCKSISTAVCGNGVCDIEKGEQSSNCLNDCPIAPPKTGPSPYVGPVCGASCDPGPFKFNSTDILIALGGIIGLFLLYKGIKRFI